MCMIGDFVRMENVPKEKAWRGWRLWRVSGGLLESSWRSQLWYGRSEKADHIPGSYNRSGIWSYSRRPARDRITPVRGQVLLWGHTAIHRKGRRALHARIISLSDPKLAKKYGVEVCK